MRTNEKENREDEGKFTNLIKNKYKSSTGEINVVYFNARSIGNKMNELQLLVAEEKPDIVGITETWLTDKIYDQEIGMEGYTLFRKDREDEDKKRGGGLVMYIKNNLNPVCDEALTNNMFKDSLWCKINCNGQITKLGICYKSPDCSKENEINLYKLLNEIMKDRAIVMGDFNFPEIDWSCEENIDDSHPLVECMHKNFLYQHVNKPTREKNFLDLVFSSHNLVDNITVDENFETSDHNIIRFQFQVAVQNKKSPARKYNYNRANYGKIIDYIRTSKCFEETENKTVNELWEYLKLNLNTIRDKFIKKCTQSKNKAKWITKEVEKARMEKKKAWNNFKKNGRTDELYETYKNKLKLSVNVNKKAKLDFEKKIASRIKSDCKSFYSYINSKRKTSVRIGPIKDDDVLINESEDMARLLNSYFSSVFTVESETEIDEPMSNFDINTMTPLEGINITKDIVLDKLSNINIHKSEGPDMIHGRLLYELRNELAKPLSELFNKSLHAGYVPTDWKRANVIPIFKKGNKQNKENYRPVSLTSIICKLLEIIIKEHITNFLDSNDLINSSQHGFMSGKSCLSNLLDFFEIVSSEVDRGNSVDVIFLDFSKAFDKVPHKKLLKKIQSTGVRGTILDWIGNWLQNRQQRVVIEGESSKWVEVTSGVPQGSVLGPLLFIIYINDINNQIESKLNKFADDCKLMNKVNNNEDFQKLQGDLDKLYNWSVKWQMPFNINKCSVMHFGNKNNNISYMMGNQDLKNSISERDLGVIIDPSLKFDKQTNTVVNEAYKILGLINRNITFKTKDTILNLYKALVRPKLEFCIQMWRPYLRKNIDKMERVQRRATKMIYGLKKVSYEKRLERLGLTTLEQRRDRGDAIEMFKMFRGFCKIKPDTFFDLVSNRITRGHRYKLKVNRSRLDIRKYFFSQRTVSKWNRLPDCVVNSDSVNMFKNRYDKFIVDN